MPRVSEDHKAQRRDEILEAARRCFARHGYEGATVARLEEESGLSRGAIFNYFANKEELFLALASEDAERFGRLWLDGGMEGAVRSTLEEDPAWLGVYFEIGRRLRTDKAFRKRWSARAPELDRQIEERLRREQADGRQRDDVDVRTIGRFIGIVVDGLAVNRATGLPAPNVDELLTLLDDAVRGRVRPRGSAPLLHPGESP